MLNSRSIPSSPPRILLASVAIVAAILGYYCLMWPTFRDFQLALDFVDVPFCDFFVFYYPMGRDVFVTNAPVVGYQYSHFFALILHLFAMLPLGLSLTLWASLIVTTTVIATWISFEIVGGLDLKYLPLFLGVVFTSFPFLHNFSWGQVGVLSTLLILGALHSSLRGKEVGAGILLAGAVSVKYYPAIFIIPFVAGFNRKVLLSFFLACLAFFLIIPIIVFGSQETFQFLRLLIQGAYSKQISAGGENSQNAVNVVMRWLSVVGHESQAARFVLRTLSYFLAEGVALLVVIMVRSSLPRAATWSFILLSLSIPFFVATSWPHYMVYLPFCQLFLFRELREDQTLSAGLRRFLKALLFASLFLASVFALNLVGDWRDYNGAGFLFLSNTLLLGISFRLVLPQLARLINTRSAEKSMGPTPLR